VLRISFVVPAELVSASHLNGKLGVVRDFTLTDAGHPRLTVEFEQKGEK
jgi:hypothetical protein